MDNSLGAVQKLRNIIGGLRFVSIVKIKNRKNKKSFKFIYKGESEV